MRLFTHFRQRVFINVCFSLLLFEVISLVTFSPCFVSSSILFSDLKFGFGLIYSRKCAIRPPEMVTMGGRRLKGWAVWFLAGCGGRKKVKVGARRGEAIRR